MKKGKRGRSVNRQPEPELYLINEKIIVPEVFVITEQGQIGPMSTSQAKLKAKEAELDLVLVGPKATPPVAKIMDYASFKYRKQKEARKQKTNLKKTVVKVLRLSPRIGQHDLDVRINQAIKFIEKDNKVKLDILLKGREKAHADIGLEVVNKFIQTISEKIEIKVESPPKKLGAKIEAQFCKK